MNLDFIEDIEAVSENFIDYETVDESLSDPKSAYYKSTQFLNRAAYNVMEFENKAKRLEQAEKFKEAISAWKEAISEVDKYIKEAEKLPDANKYDIGAAAAPLGAIGGMAVQVVMNKGKIKNASKNYVITCFNNWKKNYKKRIEKLNAKI